MKIYSVFLLCCLFVIASLSASFGEGTLQTFTTPDGRSLNAVVKGYNERTRKIQLEREDGKELWTLPTVFSEPDQEYIQQWVAADQFMSPTKFKIKGDSDKDTISKKKTTIEYEITLENRTDFPLKDLRIEYRAFILNQGYGGLGDSNRVGGGQLLIAETLDGEKVSLQTQPVHLVTKFITVSEFSSSSGTTTYQKKTKSECLKGFWVRVYGPIIDGNPTIREWCNPPDTSEDFAWQDKTKAAARDRANNTVTPRKPKKPRRKSSIPANSLPENEVRAIAEEYEEALRNRDNDAFKRLFLNSKWRGPYLGGMWKRFENVDMSTIHGNEVYVVVDGYTEGIGVSGWIQLTPEGKIKYCPLIAPHPVEEATSAIQWLVHAIEKGENYEGQKDRMIRVIEGKGIPTFGLHQDMSNRDMKNSLADVREWLINNGDNYDNSEPRIYLPEVQMEMVERRLRSYF